MSPAILLAERPAAGEFAPYYAGYVSQVPEGDVLETLSSQLDDTLAFLRGLPAPRASHRYAEGKWTVKEVVGHMADSERIFAYRALRIARGDTTPLPGYDQDAYVRTANFDARSLVALASEFESARRATLTLFRSLDRESLARRGVANGLPVTPRALAYIIAGHERHHVEILRTRYV
jgi:uncharacterized damage-inducible protein DinB